MGGALFFSANDGTLGYELWKADQAATTTALASSANPSPAGQDVTFTATVSTQPGRGTPTGSMTFIARRGGPADRAAERGRRVGHRRARARASTRSAPPNVGDAGFADSTSPVLTQTVVRPRPPLRVDGGPPPPDTTRAGGSQCRPL